MRRKTLKDAKIVIVVEGNKFSKAIHTLSVYDNRTKKEWNQNHIHERGIEWLLNMDDMKETLNWNLNGDSSKYQFKWAQTANGYSEGYAYIYD